MNYLSASAYAITVLLWFSTAHKKMFSRLRNLINYLVSWILQTFSITQA